MNGDDRRVLLRPELAELIAGSGLDYLVVGGGGWLGLATLDILQAALGDAFHSRVIVLGSSARRLHASPGVEIDGLALEDHGHLRPRPSVLLHYAFLTKDKVASLPLNDYVSRNAAISGHVQEIARRWEPAGILLPSSGAVYDASGALESDLERNAYGALKAQDEAAFSDLAHEAGAGLLIARIFGLTGEHINKLDLYALADFLQQLSCADVVRIRAQRLVFRSYVYVGDLLELAFRTMLDPARPQITCDTAGEKLVEMADLAHLVAERLGRREVRFERQFDPTLPQDAYYGDPQAWRQACGRYGVDNLDLEGQIDRTARYLGVA